MDAVSLAIAGAAVGLAGLAAGAQLVRRRRRQGRDTALLERNAERKQNLPRSLHPVIDPNICIGSLSCLRACPEGDILGIVRGAAALVHADHCIGHGRCAAECPVGAIRLVMGTEGRGVDLPEVDAFFESSRPGVHVVGELGGMGLIKNAMEQGRQVASRLDAVLPRDRGGTDVAIVGAGPAGLAAALALRAAGRSFRILEQGAFGGSVANFPRQKLVMTEPVEIPHFGRLGRRSVSKEELLAAWQRAVARGAVKIEEGVRVEGLEGEDGRFVLQTTRGPVPARKVVLATGRRGSPRKLGVPGEELSKVSYGLADPDQYAGRRVLVVGGGDSAIESARMLAEAGADVAICHRGGSFDRAREANRSRIDALAAYGRLEVLLSAVVRSIGPSEVDLVQAGRARRLANDYVVIQAGGQLPLEFLQRVGVSLRRYHGEALGAAPGEERAAADLLRDAEEVRRRRRRALLFAAAGLLVLAFLAFHGRAYYGLAPLQRLRSPLHKALRPAGLFGHGVGIAATAFMLSNFLYAARKHWKRLKGAGGIRDWLDFHVFVGFMSPLVIAFHAAFQSNNLLATGTATALAIVVATGIVGRYIYGIVPSTGGHEVELEILGGRFERLRDRVQPLVAQARDRAPLERLLAGATAAVREGSLVFLLLRLPLRALRLRWSLARVRGLFADASRFALPGVAAPPRPAALPDRLLRIAPPPPVRLARLPRLSGHLPGARHRRPHRRLPLPRVRPPAMRPGLTASVVGPSILGAGPAPAVAGPAASFTSYRRANCSMNFASSSTHSRETAL